MSESGLTPSRVQQQLPSALNGSGKKTTPRWFRDPAVIGQRSQPI